jgi:PAS domain S-box-containing protein
MLKLSPGEARSMSARACRRQFRFSGAYVTLFVAQVRNLNRRCASQVAGFAAVAIATAAYIGWWVSLPLLSNWGSGFATVKPVTALSLIALGLALVHPGKNWHSTFAVCLVVTAIAAFDLLDQYGIDFGINGFNSLLVPRAAAPEPETLFRMISGVPVAIILVGLALALSRLERYHFASTALAGLAGAMQLYALLNYLSGIRSLYGQIETPTPLTAIGLFCVVISIILRIGATPALRRQRPLWHLQIMLGFAIITPLLLSGVHTGLRITDAQIHEGQNELMSEARTVSADVDREIIGGIENLQALAVSPSLRHGDFAAFQQQAEASRAFRHGGNIMLVDRNMQQIVNTWVPFGTPLEKAAVPEPLERALSTGKPQVASLFIVPVTQRPVPGIIVPVQVDGENRYVLVRTADQRALTSLVAAHGQRPGLHVAISDAKRRIIVQSEQENAFAGKSQLAAQWHCPGSNGVFEFSDPDGQPSLGGYACSDVTGWQTTVWEPTALIEAPVWALWRTLGWMALTAFMLVVVFALWLGRIIARSVGDAARAANALGEGSPLPLSETPVAEVNTLMAELREAAARRHAAERDLQVSRDQLQVSKNQLQLAFDATRLGWWQVDPRCSAVLVDARYKEIFDLTADEISIEDIIKRVHPDDRERFRANREATLDPTNPKPYLRHEYRIRRQDGAVRWVEGNGLAHFEGSGRERRLVSFGGTVQDITERKEREEKEHLLMREINHRAKNMLSVVDSIAHQTAARSPEDFVERFSERIQALSANQDLLVRNEWQGVDVEDLVRAQLAHFADLVDSRIGVRGPKLRLNPASAQAIGLALHELATNAGKYGALSTDRGRVDVGWGMTDGGMFMMSWNEREGPLVTAPRRRGFGTTVMEAMSGRSVGGTVDLDYAPSGVAWRLTCPAANVLESRGG